MIIQEDPTTQIRDSAGQTQPDEISRRALGLETPFFAAGVGRGPINPETRFPFGGRICQLAVAATAAVKGLTALPIGAFEKVGRGLRSAPERRALGLETPFFAAGVGRGPINPETRFPFGGRICQLAVAATAAVKGLTALPMVTFEKVGRGLRSAPEPEPPTANQQMRPFGTPALASFT